MLDFKKLKEIIESNNSFLLTTHINPDPDAIGSELIFYYILKKLGKDVVIINHDSIPENVKFLDVDNVVDKFRAENHTHYFDECDVLVALDFNHSNRIKSLTDHFVKSQKLKICIDHHQNPEEFVDFLFVDTDYSATGEILYDFIKTTNIVELDYDIALAIYSSVVTDTGSFRYERTTPNTHRMAAELLELGVNPTLVHDEIYDKNKFGRTKLLGEALSSLKLSADGKVCYMTITQNMLKRNNVEEEEIDGFVNFTLSISGVEMGFLFFELADGLKISFRSKGNLPVNELANEFNGGGHKNASGARIYGNNILDEYIAKILDAAIKYL